MPVDLVLAGPGLEDLFFERAERVSIGRTFIQVAAPEDLVSMKILSGRPKDLEDVEALLVARRSEIDLSMIRETLKLAQDLLEQSDLLPSFERPSRDRRQRFEVGLRFPIGRRAAKVDAECEARDLELQAAARSC